MGRRRRRSLAHGRRQTGPRPVPCAIVGAWVDGVRSAVFRLGERPGRLSCGLGPSAEIFTSGVPSERSMASAEQKRELDEKVTALVQTRFGGDYRAAFTHYDADGNGMIDKDELKKLLADA